jgi:hypothetical protein
MNQQKKQLEQDIANFQATIENIRYQADRQIRDFETLIKSRLDEIAALEDGQERKPHAKSGIRHNKEKEDTPSI